MRRAIGILLSGRTLFWLAFAWAFAYVTYATWASEAFGHYMQALHDSLIVQIPFALFLVIAAFNFSRAFWHRWSAGARVSCVAWAVLPAGVLVFMCGFFLSASMRQQVSGFFGRGDTVRPPWESGEFVIEDFATSIGREYIDGLGDEGVIFQYEPKLTMSSGAKRYEVGVFPPVRIGDAYYHIMDFGYAPGVSVSQAGMELARGYVIQRLLPPGATDRFSLDGLPYNFEMSMAPARTISKGEAEARVYDMEMPRYHVRIYKGEQMLFEGRSDGPVIFDEAHSLEIYGYDYWVWLEAARSPGLAVMVAGIWMMVAGLPSTAGLAMVRLLGAARRIGRDE